MSDNFNVNLGEAPVAAEAINAMPQQIAQNAANTQLQEQAVQQAVEHTKQAKLNTQQEQTETDTGGFLSEKGQVQKAQAISEMHDMMEAAKDDPALIEKAVSDAEATWPDVVNAADIKSFVYALRAGKDPAPLSVAGTAFQADGTQKNVEGKSFPKGAWIQEKADSDGNDVFVASNEPPGYVKGPAKGGSQDDKIWSNKIVPALDSQRASSRSALGVGSRALALAGRGMALLAQPTVTEQQMNEVTRELDSIVRGAAGTDSGSEQLAYNTIQSRTAKMLQYLTGAPENAVPQALKAFLADSFQRIIANSKDIVQNEFNFYKAAYPEIIEAHQNEFEAMEKMAMAPSTENIGAYAQNAPAIEPTSTIGKIGSKIGKMASDAFGGGAPAAPTTGGSNDPLGIR